MKKKFGIDWFVLSLFVLVFLAFLFPQLGVERSGYKPSVITGFGIAFIFFFYGVKLTPATFMQNVKNWKMHMLIHVSTFVLLPLLLILIKPFFSNNDVWLSMFFLAALPSTVSSSVVMVSIAKGNVPSAVFNASVSSFLGLILTPAWMGFFMLTHNIGFDITHTFKQLSFQILLPIVAGMLCNKYLGAFVKKYAVFFKTADQLLVLFIIFTSFSSSFANNVFSSLQPFSIVLLLLGCIALLFFIWFILNRISALLGFTYEDTITTMFCGSNKSLLHGVVFSKVLFAGSALSGFILLPIMMYHAIQLIAMSVYAQRQSKLK